MSTNSSLHYASGVRNPTKTNYGEIVKKKHEMLNLFLRLANTDVEQLNEEERRELAGKLWLTLKLCNVHGLDVETSEGNLPLYSYGTAESEIERCYKAIPALRRVVSSAVDITLLITDTVLSDYMPEKIQIPPQTEKATVQVTWSYVNEGDHQHRDWVIKSELRMDSEIETAVLYHFYRLLHGVPATAFYQCPECSTWFVHTSKKKKIYCTSKCASRVGARAARERIKKQKDKYERVKREDVKRARKTYVKNVREKMGNENQKVERRPYKYKDESSKEE